MNRRHFFRIAIAPIIATSVGAANSRPPRILLRNGWQSINIGDIAHYLGFLEMLQEYLPDAEVRFWASNLENGADELLHRRFPKCIVLNGEADIVTAFKECDFFLHGSGSGFVAQRDTARWRKETGKPYGVLGISFFGPNKESVEVLSDAKFVYFRDSVSLKVAQDSGVTCPIMAFGPDTAFGVVKLRNDEAATAFLKANGLEEGKFLCCIPRYRWTPRWTFKKNHPFDEEKHKRNEEMKEYDHAQLRAAIIAVTRETDMKVLITCEDQTQILLGKEMVYDPLPDDVKKKVVWRDKYWLTDEALSTFVRSAGLFGNEMHSPIICISSGIPAIVCRFDEQTTKGFMWRDIGLNDWLFSMENPDEVARIAPTVLSLAKDPAAAKAKAAKAREIVLQRQKETMTTLLKALASASKLSS